MAYIDLGLPSGTLWSDRNEDAFYTYDEAIEKLKENLPTKKQWEELRKHCTWQWSKKGYTITGKNGNSIFLSMTGYHDCDGIIHNIHSYGRYWSSTPGGSDYAWGIYFYFGSRRMYIYDRCCEKAIRLVKNITK